MATPAPPAASGGRRLSSAAVTSALDDSSDEEAERARRPQTSGAPAAAGGAAGRHSAEEGCATAGGGAAQGGVAGGGGARAAPPLLERCAPPADDAVASSTGLGSGAASPEPSEATTEDEVFEIRDFTTASAFERIAHQITLAAKKWAGVLRNSSGDEDGQIMRAEFDHAGFKYDLLFQLVPTEDSSLGGAASPDRPRAAPASRLGMHTFPMRAHRLQRWFGVHHFLVVSVRDQDMDLDSARTVLSAAVLAVRGVTPGFSPAISCFVPVDGGRRRRYLGELVAGGSRAVYTVDQRNRVDAGLEHLEGLEFFFRQKLAYSPQEAGQSLMIGARFTYLADAFDPPSRAAAGATALGPPGLLAASTARARKEGPSPPSSSASTGSGESHEADGAASSADTSSAPEGHVSAEEEEADPVESMQLHCLWPSFPRDSFVDNAVYSELDPRHAPYWKIRVMRADEAPLPLARALKTLLEFRKEALTVRSVGQTAMPQVPKTALASLSLAIQESLESILLPSEAEMMELVAECLDCPTVAASSSRASGLAARLAPLRGSYRGTRVAKFAEHSAKMRCFKGAVMLWCHIIARLRQQWDALDPPPPGAELPPTRCIGARGVRAEHFDTAGCLVQQKLEMLLRSVAARAYGGLRSTMPAPRPTELKMEASGEPLLDPPLLEPSLLTEDMVTQLDTAAASIADPSERAELHGREVRSDMAAFKAANPQAALEDFVAWRGRVAGLSAEPFPETWLRDTWAAVAPKAAAEQAGALFEPEREAEMALHYLENIDGTQLLLQVFRVRLCLILEELSQTVADSDPAHLRVLRDRAVAAALAAFNGGFRGSMVAAVMAAARGDYEASAAGAVEVDAVTSVVGEAEEFPSEDALQGALAAVEALEAAVRLAASLRAKLPGPAAVLVEELLSEGEAAVTSHAQRRIVEDLFARSRVLAQVQGREAPDGRGVFESLPLAKEFVLLLQPATAEGRPAPADGGIAGCKRMYAEIRERHLRLALARGFRIA